MNNERSRKLRELIRARDILVMPGAHDALSAQIFEAAGFAAIQCSSWGIAASAGLPEGGVHSFADNREAVRRIVQAVDVPVNADAEDGYGGPRMVYEVARELILVGAAGMNMEDRAPRASPTEPVQVIPLEAMLEKISAVQKAKASLGSEFVLNARTDVLIVPGQEPAQALEEAIRRGNAFARAGADLIFVWGAKTREQIAELTRRISAPVSISGEGLELNVADLAAFGVSRVSFGVASVRAAAGAVQRVAEALRDQGSAAPVQALTQSVDIPRLISARWSRGAP